MEAKNKGIYEAPAMNVVELKTEGGVCATGGLKNYEREDYEIW